MKLKRKVSIVTGGGQGIGYAICLRFSREGSYIVIPDIDEDKAKKTCEAIKEGGGTAIPVDGGWSAA
jgi:NAD(P)-dependent dehydrogenase (short-subunit alcohol dehydrogenase family)